MAVEKTVQIDVLIFRHKRPDGTASLSWLTFSTLFAFFFRFLFFFLLKQHLKTGQLFN